MSPWWSRPTSDAGNDANPAEPKTPHDSPFPAGPVSAASPLSESRFFDAEPEPEPTPVAAHAAEAAATEPEPEPWPPTADVRSSALESIERPAVDPFSIPYEEMAEIAEPEENGDAETHGASAFPEADEDAEGDLEGDEEEAEGEAGAEGAEPGERTGRKRGRRGGRRRRGRDRVAENGEEAPAAIAAAPRPVERPERERFEARPERAARIERHERPERHEFAELPPVDLESLTRQIYLNIPERAQSADERKIALFCDLENIALGVRDSEVKKFDIDLVLERLLEKGKIIVKRAYCDWERYSDYKRTFHEAAIEMIDIPQKHYSGKNSADIKMVVDAMDLSYSKEHLDTFVLLSGDSDFSPLVSKLKENNKYVIGIGVKNSSSALLVDNCDEFIYYEDVWRDQNSGPQLEGMTKKQSEVFGLMADAIQALKRENKDVLWGSMIKQTMKRKKPSFNEGYFGYSTFSELLEDAERRGIVKLKKDQRSGSYIVTGFAARR
jgi:uncharacterized protein (TIGR00288 family)